MRFLRENSLSIFFGAIFLATLFAQSLVGHQVTNDEALAHGSETFSYWRYISSSEFGEAVMENWESEFLQFTLFIFATIWLRQKGSPESKSLKESGLETDERQLVGRYARSDSPAWTKAGGWRTHLYSNSLVVVMATIFLAAWLGHSFTGWAMFNDEQRQHGDSAVSWTTYVSGPDFWEQSFQNWQSEFLAVGAMVVFSIYLRQRGSPESKPVGAPHDQTGRTG
jgi:hypothetical protein